MQAATHAENVIQSSRGILVGNLVGSDERKGICAECDWILNTQIGLQLGFFAFPIVPLFARNLTGAASNALSDVNQSSLNR